MDKRYEQIGRIGDGGFGIVCKCRDTVTNETVAIKRIFLENEDGTVPSAVIREVSLLKELDHSNIVRLLDVLENEESVDLVFEYLDLDLQKFIVSFPEIAKDPRMIKRIMHQILRGVNYCHSNEILHRDVKPQNLLIDVKNKIVKLADFGLARACGVPSRSLSDDVATIPYKAPELLLGLKLYSTPVDMWSVGCIFAELVTQQPLFTHTNELKMLFDIFSMFGLPNEEMFPGLTSQCNLISGMTAPPRMKNLADAVPGLEPAGVDLLSKMLCLDPSSRITAKDALKHPYFQDVAADP